jgi:putative zinc finger protein
MHLDEILIGDYVDRSLDAARRAEVDRHLEACAECRQIVADLGEIRRVAGALEFRDPPARAWQRIERAIELESKGQGRESAPASVFTRLKDSSSTLVWLAAAAALVLATWVGVRYAGRPGGPAATEARHQPSSAPSGEMSAEAVEAELRAAESHYDAAIKGLEQIANAEQGALDPQTAATLQKNLAVIDQAITESRAAVRAQPNSEPAVSSLMDNFKSKLALLQDTVALINEMRKGNEAGTARIVSGLKQKGN